MTEYEILDLIEETADLIADRCGMAVPYCESMDMTLLPVVVETMLGNVKDGYLDDLHFLAENGRLIPKKYADAGIARIRGYLLRHKQEILDEIEYDCGYYQGVYEGYEPGL